MRKYLGTMVVLLCVACDGTAPMTEEEPVQPLSPTEEHYGKTYEEWAGEWSKWVYELPLDEDCSDPISDPTGELCATYQDPESPVFFLTGNFGGKTTREDCVIPEGKALFMPVIITWHDNGGVPEDIQLTDEQLQDSSMGETAGIEEVAFEVDGYSVDLDPFLIEAAPYSYTIPREPNIYSCQGGTGVTGSYDGYSNGYFVLLPPLRHGEHTVAFSATTATGFNLNVSYDPLIVE